MLSKIKNTNGKKVEKKRLEKDIKNNNTIEKKVHSTSLGDNDLLNLNKNLEIQRNSSVLFQNKTNEMLNLIKSLKLENRELKKQIFPDLKPFLKTLNDMEIYTYGSLNSFKPSLDSLMYNNEIFHREIKKEINDIRERLNLKKRNKVIKKDRNSHDEDIFKEDENFLQNQGSEEINN